MARRISIAELTLDETADYIAIHKPARMTSLHERDADGSSVIELIEQEGRTLQLCHRIDKDTSGVLLLAKNPEAYRHASIQFEHRKVGKVYHCVSEGVHPFEHHTIDLPLHVTRSGRNSVNYLKGKPSQTVVHVLEQFGHYTLIEAKPISGRLHQIRAHLSAVNAPIAGDVLYGGHWPYLSRLKRNFSTSKQREEQPMIRRFALHARSIALPLPDGTTLDVEAPYPKDMEVFLKLLRKYDSQTPLPY